MNATIRHILEACGVTSVILTYIVNGVLFLIKTTHPEVLDPETAQEVVDFGRYTTIPLAFFSVVYLIYRIKHQIKVTRGVEEDNIRKKLDNEEKQLDLQERRMLLDRRAKHIEENNMEDQ